MSDNAGQVGAAPTDVAAVADQVVDQLPSDQNVDDSGVDVEGEIAELEAQVKAGDISKKEAQNLKKKLKIKVDGEDLDVDFDMGDEAAVIRELQKSRAFDKRSKEWASYKSQVDQLMEMLQNDPEGLLEKMGKNVDEMAEKRLSRKIDELKKDPKELEAEKMRKELEDLKKEKKEASERAEKAELERMRNEHASKIETDISSALEGAKSYLPKNNPDVLRRVALKMAFAIQNGYPQVEAKDVIPMVEKEYKEEISKLLAVAPDDVLEALVSKDRLTEYRKSQVKRSKDTAATNKPKITDTGTKKEKEEKPKEGYKLKNFFRPY